MISDSLDNLHKYKSSVPGLDKLIAFLSSTDISTLSNGRYAVDADSVYIMISEYTTEPENMKKWEAHRRYIDIQIVLSGEEYIGHTKTAGLKVMEPYSSEKDVTFYKDSPDSKYSQIHLTKGNFCALFPEDAHKPGCHNSTGGEVKKAVVKVLI